MLTKLPNLNDALRLIRSHSFHWNRLGQVLEVSFDYRKELKSSKETNIDRLEKVLEKWIDSESVPVTWGRLIEALEEIELKGVIRSVRNFLKSAQPTDHYQTGHSRRSNLSFFHPV